MAKIVFRKSLNQDAKIADLDTKKVNLATFNSSINDLQSKLDTLRTDTANADKEVKAYAEQLVTDLKTGDVKALQDAVAKLNGGEDVAGSVDSKISAAISGLVDGAPEAYNTIKELLNLINKDDADLNGLIDAINNKVKALVGNASEEYSTLENVEKTVKAIDAKIQAKFTSVDANIVEVQESVPMYKFDGGLAIGENNVITLTAAPKGDIIGRRAEVYTIDNNGLMIVEGMYTVTPVDGDDTGKKFTIESDADLTSYKADVQYFWTVAGNK